MRLLFTLLLAVSSFCANAQAVIADPALGQVTIANIVNQNIIDNPPSLALGVVFILKVPIKNLSATNSIPPGSVKVKIDFGSKLILDPTFILATASTSNYFNWAYSFDTEGGQFQLTGDGFGLLPIPPGYSDTASFLVRGSLIGFSTTRANFLVTNHNTTIILSDNNLNNVSFQDYVITSAPLPVTFTGLFLKKDDCDIDVTFTSENEINLKHYEVEYSSDGVNFQRAGKVETNSLRKYNFKLKLPQTFTKGKVFVRIKSVDNDTRSQYSEIKMLKDVCEAEANIYMFPNPLTASQSSVTLVNKKGRFTNGNYNISLFDVAGKIISSKQQILFNASEIKFNTGNISSGNYFIKVHCLDGVSETYILKLQKQN